jgi:DNA-binding LacI/PurR family transcriptional regulator
MSKARYQIITNALMEQIRNGKFKPGDRIPSSSELCNTYSVSQITALRVFKELTTGNFISKKEGRGYYVNGGTAINRQEVMRGAIGSLLRPLRPWQAEDNYFNEINCATQNEAGRRRINLLWSYACSTLNEHYIPPHHLQMEIQRAALAMADKVDGFLLDERISDVVIIELLKKVRKPLVLINRRTQLPVDTINSANQAGSAKLAETAIKFGYEHFIICDSGDVNVKNRGESFRQTLLNNGIPGSRISEISKCHINPNEVSMKAIFDKIKVAQKQNLRIFVFCVTDSFARSACRELLTRGMKPGKNIGLAGFGGFGHTTIETPEIATVDIKSTEMGVLAVDKLLYKIANPFTEAQNHTPDFELRFGDTM